MDEGSLALSLCNGGVLSGFVSQEAIGAVSATLLVTFSLV
jgi:hypothetical protein